MQRSRRADAVDAVLVAIACAVVLRSVVRAPAWTVDDAYIVARYAERLVHEGRLAFNADGAPVEGFTSPLAVVWASAAVALGIDPIGALAALGAFAAVLSVPIVFAVGRVLRLAPPSAGVVALVYAGVGEHVAHARSGLETSAYGAASLALAWALARALRSDRAPVLPLALTGTVAALTRPEGLAAAALAAALLLARRRRRPGALRRAWRTLALGFVVPVALLLAARAAYFGALLPNTFYAKRGAANGVHAADLLSLAADYFVDLVAVAIVAWASARLAGLRLRRIPPRQWRLVAFALGVMAVDTAAYARATPVMNYARRLAIHSVAALVVVALVATGVTVGRARRARGLALYACLAIAVVAGFVRGEARADAYRAHAEIYAASARDVYLPVVAIVRAETAPGATIAVYPDAGIVPYLTHRRTIDFGRLNDAFLARQARTTGDIVDYFFRSDVAALVVSEPDPPKLYDAGADAIVRDSRFDRAYELRARVGAGLGRALRVYLRREP